MLIFKKVKKFILSDTIINKYESLNNCLKIWFVVNCYFIKIKIKFGQYKKKPIENWNSLNFKIKKKYFFLNNNWLVYVGLINKLLGFYNLKNKH